VLEAEDVDIKRLKQLVEEMKRWSFKRDQANFTFLASQRISSRALIERAAVTVSVTGTATLEAFLLGRGGDDFIDQRGRDEHRAIVVHHDPVVGKDRNA
jgi:hypothetical protein